MWMQLLSILSLCPIPSVLILILLMVPLLCQEVRVSINSGPQLQSNRKFLRLKRYSKIYDVKFVVVLIISIFFLCFQIFFFLIYVLFSYSEQ